jgi:hypothetical protein
MDDAVIRIRDREPVKWDPAIAELVEPIAAYICAADDPGQAIMIIAVHLGIEANAILTDARAAVHAFQVGRDCRER